MSLKDSIINQFRLKDYNWSKIDSVNKVQIVNYKKIIDNQDAICKVYASKIHRQKLKNLFLLISIVGVGAVLSNK